MKNKFNEEVLVLKRKIIIDKFRKIEIFNRDENYINLFLNLIIEKKEFIKRGLVENYIKYKQIIPYIIFKFKNKYFLMQRKSTHSDQRLASKYSLGIGGHLNKSDLGKNNQENLIEKITAWAIREFYEEVNYKGKFEVSFLGILNDESDDVGKVHCGLILLFDADSDNISVRDEHKSGKLVTFKELKLNYENLENWSKIIFNKIFVN